MSAARKIAALEALAASTTFAGEREAALAAAARLRAKPLDGDDEEWDLNGLPTAEEIDHFLDQVEWAVAYLKAEPAPADYCGRTDMWVVAGVGPPLDNAGLVALARGRGFAL